MVLCSLDWGAHGGNEYWRILLEKLTLTSIQLPDDAIYVPLGRKTPIWKPVWGSMLSVVDGGLAPVSCEDLDPAMVQAIQRESSGYTLDVLKNQLRPRDAVETTPGGDKYVVSDTVAPSSPCRVPNPDVVSNLPKCNAKEGRGGEAKAQHKKHTEHYSKLPVYFTSVLYIPLYGTLVP